MKISLVLCPFWDIHLPPLSLAILSACLKKEGYSVTMFDLNKILYNASNDADKAMWEHSHFFQVLKSKNLVELFFNENCKMVNFEVDRILNDKSSVIGFSVYNSTKEFSLKIAAEIKKRDKNKIIIFGGPECFFEGDKLIKENSVDIVVTAEGDEVFSKLLKCIKDGGNIDSCKGIWHKKNTNIFYTGPGNYVADLNTLPKPDFAGLIDLYRNKEGAVLPIQSSRGCINHCAFCNEVVLGEKYRTMNAKRMVEEIVHAHNNYGVNHFYFVDSLINGNMEVLNTFCDLLIKHKLDLVIKGIETKSNNSALLWSAHAVIRPEMNLKILNKMKQAGCVYIVYGIESGSQKVLNSINKNYLISTAYKVIKNTFKAGISCYIFTIIGLPQENDKDFSKTMSFIKKIRPYIKNLMSQNICMIFKGSCFDKMPMKYNITDNKHSLFWESNSGQNNYKIRLKRYDKLVSFTGKLGFKRVYLIEDSIVIKRMMLEDYSKYKSENKGTSSAEGLVKFKRILLDGYKEISGIRKKSY